MKQILENLKTGDLLIKDVACPRLKPGHLLIQTTHSLISAGTERMLVDFARGGYLSKAMQQPERVKEIIDKARTDGLISTINAVQSRMDEPLPLGYCNAGVVLEVGGEVKGFKLGDRVASNGPHAEIVCVPKNLCAKIPIGVSDEQAAFTVISSIALHGIRMAEPTLGERFVVYGLGLIGLITLQLLRASGCQVLGIDINPNRLNLAERFGAVIVNTADGGDLTDAADAWTEGKGVDGVLITASTKSKEIIHQSAEMCRKRARIVLVGETPLNLRRSDFYKKELTFMVSCSYGPGRYDPEYEVKGHDYPLGYVRWTEQRNFQTVLDLMAAGKLDVNPLISHRFPFEQAQGAYDLITKSKESYIGIILEYGKDDSDLKAQSLKHTEGPERIIQLKSPQPRSSNLEPQSPIVGMIGAGKFTRQVLLPAIKKTGARLKTIASSGGISGTHLGKKFGFEESTTDTERIFKDLEIDTVFIATRNDTHARFVMAALEAGKHVFVEKPLCITLDELQAIKEAYEQSAESHQLLMIGFNRRFAPHVVKMKELLKTVREAKSFIMTVNAGILTPDHWTQDPEVGGGRIIGEVCHFIDLVRFLVGTEINSSDIVRLKSGFGDTASIQLSFIDGSIGVIHYFTNGNRQFPKERLEVFCAGKILLLDNFKTLKGYGWNSFKKMKLWRQDKGHSAEMEAFVEAIQNGRTAPIAFNEIVEVTRETLEFSKR